MTAVRHIERRAARLPAPEGATVVLAAAEFHALPEYSCSIPTGTAIGKRWKRRIPYRLDDPHPVEWWLGEYYDMGLPSDVVGIRWTRIEVLR